MIPRFRRLRFFSWGALILLVAGCGLKYAPQTGEEIPREIAQLEKRMRGPGGRLLPADFHLQLAWLYLDHRNPQVDYAQALEQFEAYVQREPAGAGTDEIRNWLAVLRELDLRKREYRQIEGKMEGLAAAKAAREGEAAAWLKRNQDLQKALEESQTRLESVQKAREGLSEKAASLMEANENLRAMNEKMRAEKRKLEEANAEMTKTIEKLKMLDLQIEEKRQQIK